MHTSFMLAQTAQGRLQIACLKRTGTWRRAFLGSMSATIGARMSLIRYATLLSTNYPTNNSPASFRILRSAILQYSGFSSMPR